MSFAAWPSKNYDEAGCSLPDSLTEDGVLVLTGSRIWQLLLLVAISSTAAAASSDQAAIEAVESKQAAAWNAHDAAAYADLFTPDGDVVNVIGWWWKGREEIRRKLTDAFAF